MILRSLAARSFRNLGEAELAFHERANVIVGDNGQGKTNLLEAIYFLATTKSFRTPRTTNLVRENESALFVRGAVHSEAVTRTLSIGLDAQSERRRELRINEEKVSLQKYVSALRLFAYSAARLEILRGGPEERRRFLDRGIAGIRPTYLADLNRYQRALQQRNALLQRQDGSPVPQSTLEAWDEELIQAAIPIVTAREEYASALKRELDRIVAEHSYHVTNVSMRYEPSGFTSEGSVLRDRVASLRRRELDAGFTMWGPHRDQLTFEISGRPAHDILSSGEIKMLVLFLKFAKIAIYQSRSDDAPLFLLDDVDAELDLGIIQRLLSFVVGSVQLFTTTAKESILAGMPLSRHLRISMKNGVVTSQQEIG